MDWKKITNAALIPVITLIIVRLVSYLSFLIPVSTTLAGIAVFLVSIPVLFIAGYLGVKKYSFGVKGAALVGAIAGFVPSLLDAIVAIVFIALLLPMINANFYETQRMNPSGFPGHSSYDLNSQEANGQFNAAVMIASVIAAAVMVIFNTLIGAIVGAVGGVVAEKRKPKQS